MVKGLAPLDCTPGFKGNPFAMSVLRGVALLALVFACAAIDVRRQHHEEHRVAKVCLRSLRRLICRARYITGTLVMSPSGQPIGSVQGLDSNAQEGLRQ